METREWDDGSYAMAVHRVALDRKRCFMLCNVRVGMAGGGRQFSSSSDSSSSEDDTCSSSSYEGGVTLPGSR